MRKTMVIMGFSLFSRRLRLILHEEFFQYRTSLFESKNGPAENRGVVLGDLEVDAILGILKSQRAEKKLQLSEANPFLSVPFAFTIDRP